MEYLLFRLDFSLSLFANILRLTDGISWKRYLPQEAFTPWPEGMTLFFLHLQHMSYIPTIELSPLYTYFLPMATSDSP